MNSRYKFIRSQNPFEGLEDYVHSPYQRVKNKFPEYPIQLWLDFENVGLLSGFGLRSKLGKYFEILTAAIFGAGIKQRYEVNGAKGELYISEPDVIKKSRVIEVKGVSRGESLKISWEQLGKYAIIQKGETWLKTPLIEYVIFRHGVRKLVTEYKNSSLEELVSDISKSIRSMYKLPFSLVVEICKSGTEFTSIYDGARYDSLTRILSSGLNHILAYPEKTLEKLGLQDKYFIKKTRFPGTVTLSGFEINPFPVIFFEDKNHGEFLRKFKAEYFGADLDFFKSGNFIKLKDSMDIQDIPF